MMTPDGQTDVAILSVAPTGSRKTRQDHPNLPITPAQVAATAAECLDAGAAMIHVHVRDDQGRHTLDEQAYRRMINRVVQEIGRNLVIQVTTESCGMYHPGQQIDMVRRLRPESISLAIAEFIPDKSHESAAAEFFEWLDKEHIYTQFIFYSADQISYFQNLLQRGLISTIDPCVLFVLGRHAKPQLGQPEQLDPFLTASTFQRAWFVCAFGEREGDCVGAALSQGGHARVGFENNLLLPSGEQAQHNADLIADARARAFSYGRATATANDVRRLFQQCLES